MLRTNLSTRPFYNERAIHVSLMVAAIVVLLRTVFNGTQIVVLTRRQNELGARAAAAERQAREFRADAQKIRQGLDPKQMQTIAGAAREANALIDRRLFSWTNLLNHLETTLPDDVRIASIRPKIDRDGTINVALSIVGRRVQDIDQFMENLEATGAFAGVLSLDENVNEDGTLQAVIGGRYVRVEPAKGGSQ
jgi:Tfp pilus assembly protein PilN